MTSPEPDESFAPEAGLEPLIPEKRDESPVAKITEPVARMAEPVVGWAKAIALGIGDTAKDMLHEGRRGARDAMEDGWDRFDDKTKNRRRRGGR